MAFEVCAFRHRLTMMGQITANVRKLSGQREELFINKQNVKITLNLTRKIKICHFPLRAYNQLHEY